MHIDTGVLRAELTDCCAKDSWTKKRELIVGFAIKRDLFVVCRIFCGEFLLGKK